MTYKPSHLRKVALIACQALFFSLLGLIPARAQFTGLTSITAQPVNVSNCGSGVTFSAAGAIPNLGQTVHFIQWTTSGTLTDMSIRIYAQFTPTGAKIPISDWGTDPTGNGQLTAFGSYPILLIGYTCNGSGGTASLTVNYSGTYVSPIQLPGSIQDQITYTKVLCTNCAAGSSFSGQIFNTPYGRTDGAIVFKYNGGAGGPATSTITIGTQTGYNFASLTFMKNLGPLTLATQDTSSQIFPMPSQAASILNFSFTSGGASTDTYTAFYVFSKPGFQAGASTDALTEAINLSPILAEKGARWSVLNSPGASSQATASKAAGPANTSIRHVADCVSWSAGAATAPAATVLTINLRDGASGAGTIIWQTQITAAATAAQHGSGSVCGLNLIGSNQTAMTIEFSALLTNEAESVSLTGYDVE